MSLSSKAQHFSYKTLFLILVLLLIPVVLLLRLNQRANPASAGWFDDSWGYRQALNIATHTVGETNVYIIASVNIGSTTKSQPDSGDFRFTTYSGQLLDYYISAGAGTTAPTFHINFASFPSGAQTIYAYYGNPSTSNGFALADFSTEASNYSFGSAASEELGGGPIAYWKFDEGSGSTVNNSAENKTFTGSIIGPTWQTEDQCLSGKCLYQDGLSNKYTRITPDITSGWAANNDFTINLWFNCMGEGISVGSTQYNYLAGLFIHGTSADSGTGGFYLRQSSISCANMIFQVSATTVSRSITPNLTSGLNKWAMITAQKEGDTLKLYENSKLVGSQTFAGENWNVNINAQTLIGSVHGRSVKGFIDEVKVYPYARSAAEIKQDYNLGAATLVGHKQEIAQVTPLKSKLLAHYKFDEGYSTNAHDSTSNAYTGTIATPVWSSDGIYNKALGFDGTNTNLVLPAALGTIANFGGTDGVVTFSMWLYVDTDNTDVFIVHNLGGAWYYLGLNASRVFQGMVYNCTTSANYWPTSTTPIPLNTWTHVVSEFSGDGYKFYINGKLDKSVSDSNLCFNNPGTPHFGLDNVGWSNFKGKIDDLKVYNYALTADEIKLDYNQGSAMQLGSLSSGTGNTAPSSAASQEYCVPGDGSTCSAPLAEWKFEEGSGNTAYDSSSNGNNQTLGSGATSPTWVTGKVGKALSFNGSTNYSYRTMSPNLGNDITFDLWYKPRGNGFIFDRNWGWIYLQQSGSSVNFVCNLCTTITSNSSSLNNWHHATGICSATAQAASFYLDGSLVSSVGCTQPSFGDNPITLGAVYMGQGGNYYNGLIDQFRVYNYARSPAQIAWDYNRGTPVAQYKFDECQGTVAHDSVGTNNGTINIGASVPQTTVGTCNIGTTDSAWFNGATGKTNASLNFDGTDDYIQIAQPNIQTTPNLFTITGFIKPANHDSFFITPASNGIDQYLTYNGASQRIGVNIAEATDTNVRARYSQSNSVPVNTWTHFAVSINDKNIKIYINGKLNSEYNEAINIAGWSSVWRIGQRGNSTYWYKGQIDDVQIFNYALTAAQAKTVYNDGAVNFR
ncbi:MAG: LamG-like jellyroll fold domain-containing protein [Candidatus Shapirobacteria bacterium]